MTDPEEKKTISIRDEITTGEGKKVEAGTVETPKVEAPMVMPNWWKALSSDSPNKEIGEYMAHPLNFDSTPSTGRIIRGLEGIIGNLNKSMVDIAVGMMQKIAKMFERKAEQE